MTSHSKQQSGSMLGSSGRKCDKREREESEHDAVNNQQNIAELKEELLNKKVDKFFIKNDNRPMWALWDALNDETSQGSEVPMAIIMNPRCGIERRVEEKELQASNNNWRIAGETPLLMATRAGRNDVILALLSAGADRLATDCCGLNAFMKAALTGQLSTLELLADYEPDLTAASKLGYTALHLAAWDGCSEAIQLILQLGANLEARNELGQTPLFSAARNMKLNAVATLLNSGACIDAVDEGGYTPMHWAAFAENGSAVEALVREGTSVTAVAEYKDVAVAMFWKFYSPVAPLSNAKRAAILALLTPTYTKCLVYF